MKTKLVDINSITLGHARHEFLSFSELRSRVSSYYDGDAFNLLSSKNRHLLRRLVIRSYKELYVTVTGDYMIRVPSDRSQMRVRCERLEEFLVRIAEAGNKTPDEVMRSSFYNCLHDDLVR